jgi:hypothetical protein
MRAEALATWARAVDRIGRAQSGFLGICERWLRDARSTAIILASAQAPQVGEPEPCGYVTGRRSSLRLRLSRFAYCPCGRRSQLTDDLSPFLGDAGQRAISIEGVAPGMARVIRERCHKSRGTDVLLKLQPHPRRDCVEVRILEGIVAIFDAADKFVGECVVEAAAQGPALESGVDGGPT